MRGESVPSRTPHDDWKAQLDHIMSEVWGGGTIFKGSTLTFGATIYHGDSPINRYSTFDLTADRFDTS